HGAGRMVLDDPEPRQVTRNGALPMRIRLAVVLAALLGATAFAPAPLPRRTRETNEAVTLQRMDGIWEVVSMWRYGPNGQVASHVTAWKTVRIRDGRWNYCREVNGGLPSSTWQLVIREARPARLDFCYRGGDVLMAGVVRFRGGTLEVLYSASTASLNRPLSFESPPENHYLVRLKKSY